MTRVVARVMAVALGLVLAQSGAVQAETVLRVDARPQSAAPSTGFINTGTLVAPNGETLGINSRYMTRNGSPWLPVMGEFHYVRYPHQYWEEQLLKMKATGVKIVATYVIWNYHEEQAGQFDFTGDRDLRAFLELCAKHQLLAWVRIGPWAHGEARFGGIPDWVVRSMPTRGSDPIYLEYVRRYWTQVANQLRGLLWKDGGPVIGLQLENEYNLAGPNRGPEHIADLKRMALSLGIDTPFYSVTGWDGALYPPGEVVSTFAGYPDEPWDTSAEQLSPREVYMFRFDSRVAGNAGTQTAATAAGTWIEDRDRTPFLGAEFGGGVPTMYRRRAILMPDDIGAMPPVQLGSGVNLYGYYMFQGGRNLISRTTLEENTLIGNYNDCPIISYDFQAPLGQYGQQHETSTRIRRVHYFLDAFGKDLAPMPVHRPITLPSSRDDLETPRYSIRSLGESGFLFLNNYVRQFQMQPQRGVQFEVDLPGGALKFPSRSIDIPSGAYLIWPFNLNIDGLRVAYATAQPITKIESGKSTTLVLFAQEGIPVEVALDKASYKSVRVSDPHATREEVDGLMVISGVVPGTSEAIKVATATGVEVSVVVLTEKQSRDAWVVDFAGRRHLLLSPSQVFATERELIFRSVGSSQIRLGAFPAITTESVSKMSTTKTSRDGIFEVIDASVPSVEPLTASVSKVREAQSVPPVAIGGVARAAVQPYPEVFGRSAAWSLKIDPSVMKGVSDVFLEIVYQGDVARLFTGTEMLDDSYFDGRPWRIGLKRFAGKFAEPLNLTVLPLRPDAPIYIDQRFRPSSEGPQVARVDSVRLIPEYEIRFSATSDRH